MACKTCKLKIACKHFKGICPWLYIGALTAAVLFPGYLLLRG